MIGHPAAPGPCQGQAAMCDAPVDKTVDGNHGESVSSYGDIFRSKLSSSCRIVFLNPNGMGYKANSFKMTCMYSFLRRHKVDFFGISETNVDWRLIEHNDNVWGRMQEWFEAKKVSVAHNRVAKQRETAFQAGGTISLTIDKLANVRGEVGHDSRDLGRWSWILVKGRGRIRTRFVTVYCPCRNTKIGNSTYQQQVAYFTKQNMPVCPIKQFWEDLIVHIKEWRDSGEQLILGGDWNHPIATVNKHLQPLGLHEAITSAHGLENAPATHKRGSRPIDGVYVNSTLQITRGGYLPFNKGIISDHRALWLDIPLSSIIGFSSYSTSIPKARRLKNKDPRVKKRYQDYLHNFAVGHGLYFKVADLLRRTTYPMTKKTAKGWISFERVRKQGMVAADNRCRKLPRGVHPWSPSFARIRDEIKMWTMIKERKLRQNVSVNDILKIARRLRQEIDFGLPLQTVKSTLDDKWMEYKKIKEESPNLRKTYLRDLAEAKAAEDNTLASTKLKQLIHEEEQRNQAKAIKYTTGKLFGTGLTRVLVPAPDGDGVIEIADRAQLEKVLLASNPLKYHQCENYCELMKGQLLQDIGLCGEGPMVGSILDGSYECPPGTSRGTREFLRHMKRHPQWKKVQHISARSSVEEFCSRWKRAKESSSSHGALHNGHYKAGCDHRSLRYLHYACAEILYISGCYLDRHREGIDVMLLKAAENYHIDRLRTICLLDSELNMNMGRVGTDGLCALLALNDMADEQYSRPCRSAIDHVVNRKLTFDYFTFRRQPYALCSCDLAGNYDRIAHAAASLALQRVGVPLPRIVGLFETLQRMIKKIRTAFGDSSRSYGASIPFPYQLRPMGVYQGNRIGPPIWSVISSSVFSILSESGYGVDFINAVTSDLYHLVGFAYVDDTDLIQSGGNAFTVAEDMQEAITLWEEIMRATGQSMAPDKSWWYLIDFAWKFGKWTYTDGSPSSTLTATHTNGNRLPLDRLSHSASKKMLGVYLSPSGNKKDQLLYLQGKAQVWAEMIRVGHLGPNDTWVAMSSGIWKSLLYPLPVTSFTTAELRSISKPILDVALPRMSLNRNTSIALRHGPRRLGGFGIVHLENFQGITKLQYLIEHPWKGTPTGRVLMSNVSYLILECGVYGNIFSIASDPLKWTTATDSWVGYAWDFMSAHDIKITNYNAPFLSPNCEGDCSLMSSFADSGATIAQLQALNRCRLYLKVVSLSDICTADGTTILATYFMRGRSYPSVRHRNSFDWPYQDRPPQKDWKIWTDFILRTFCDCTSGKLKAPLGAWTLPISFSSPAWDWFGVLDDDDNLLYLWFYDGSTWTKLVPKGGRTRQKRFQRKTCDCPAPPDSPQPHCRVSVEIFKDSSVEVICRSAAFHSQVPNAIPSETNIPAFVSPECFLDYIRQCKEFGWFLRRTVMPPCLSVILRDFISGSIYCVSDGSYHPRHKFGTANWRIESLDRRTVIEGFCIVPGHPSEQSSFRSELAGLLGLSAFLWALAKVLLSFGVPEMEVWEIIVGCDGYSALYKALLTTPDRLSSSHKHFDLISAIMGFWKNMPCSPFAVHVYGHQDEICPRKPLSRLEKMNITTDIKAKSFLRSCLQSNLGRPSGTFTFGMPTVTIRGTVVSSDFQKTLLDKCSEHDLRQYWHQNWKFSDFEFESLAWPAFERAMGMIQRSDQKFIVKWLSRMVTVGATIRRYQSDHNTRCLRCNKETETLSHCIRCAAIRPYVLRQYDHFSLLLLEYGTCPVLVEGIKLCTFNWLRKTRTRPAHFLAHLEDRETVFVLCQHYSFGWYNFLQGLHFSSLTDLQTRYFDSTNSSKSILYWHGRVISSLWRILLALRKERKDFLTSRRETLDPSFPAVQAALLACAAEHERGLDTLPPLYSPYFRCTANVLLSREASAIRTWLRTIRLARETLCKEVVYNDEFTPQGSFRAWLLKF